MWLHRLALSVLSRNIVREVIAYFDNDERPFVVRADSICMWNAELKEWTAAFELSERVQVSFNSIAVRTDSAEFIVGCAGPECKCHTRYRDVSSPKGLGDSTSRYDSKPTTSWVSHLPGSFICIWRQR